ncbi:MAG: HYR domain-containing protein [Nitrosopumilus sp.]|nr:HYR domain-containing protein [Nitrosopumilus sp.]MDA7943891.1 HYR domain-containing protein [Nitrosopumilus sp.]MDA7998974.1 HYR domain-containing protein [Nitrosopumilus sp.]
MALATAEAYGQSTEFLVPLGVVGQSGAQNASSVGINIDALSQPTMEITVFGETVTVTHEETYFKSDTEYTYVGSTPGLHGNVFIAVIGDVARMELDRPVNSYVMGPSDGEHRIVRYDPAGYLSDVEGTDPPPLNPNHARIVRDAPRGEFSSELYEKLEINVIYLYTDAAEDHFEDISQTGVQLVANIATIRVNRAFAHSDMPLILNDVGLDNAQLGYREAGMATDLKRLITKNDRMLEFGLADRERENADIGVFITKQGERDEDMPRHCGQASGILASPDDAFVIANMDCDLVDHYDRTKPRFGVPLGTIMAHEIGHLFGARHQIAYDDNAVPFPYGHGYVGGRPPMATLMAFCGDPRGDPRINPDKERVIQGCTHVNQWSDPDTYFFGTTVPSGTARAADNARVITQMGPYVASFRGGAETYEPKYAEPEIRAPTDRRVEAGGMLTAVELGTPRLNDNVDPKATTRSNAPDEFPLGRTIVVWSVIDRLNRVDTDHQFVRVVDTTGPAFSDVPAPVTRASPSPAGVRVTFDLPEAQDLVDGARTVTASPRSGTIFPVGNTTVTFTASDASGNTSTETLEVRVTYVDPATIVTPDRVLFEDGFDGALSAWTFTGYDVWESGDPAAPVPGSAPGNKILRTSDCSHCAATLNRAVDTSRPISIEFDRFLSRSLERDEGFSIEYSEDNGSTWKLLTWFTEFDDDDNGAWTRELVPLETDASSVRLRFSADTSQPNEHVQLDNLVIKSVHKSRLPVRDAHIMTFQDGLEGMVLGGRPTWSIGPPVEHLPFSQEGNLVLKDGRCFGECTAQLGSPIDTSAPLVIKLDRYVLSVRGDQGLFIEYSADGGATWGEAGSFKSDIRFLGDWRTSFVYPEIDADEVLLRFTARGNAHTTIEIDNVFIKKRGDASATLPDMGFTAELSASAASLNVTFPEPVNKRFRASDFELSHGTVVSVDHPRGSMSRTLEVAGVQFGIPLVVTYAGAPFLGGVLDLAEMQTGTAATAPGVERPDRPPVISGTEDVKMEPGEIRSLRVRAVDPDGDAVSVRLEDPPGLAAILAGGGGNATITLAPGTGDVGTHRITVVATSGALSSTASFTVTVTEPDTAPPSISAPPDVSAEATGPLTAVDLGSPDVSDARDPSPEVSSDAPASFPPGSTTVTWTARDASGNSASDEQLVVVRDTTPPVLNVTGDDPHAHQVLDEYTDAGAVCDDLVDGVFAAEADTSGVVPDDFGTYEVSYRCTDSAGNNSTGSRTVIAGDTVPPRIVLRSDPEIGHYVGARPPDTSALCKDLVSGTRHVQPDALFRPSEPGVQVLRYACEDFAGNRAPEVTLTITVMVDREPPVMMAPPDIIVEATGSVNKVPLGRYSTSDNADPVPLVSSDAPDLFRVGNTTITWTARDFAGNTGTDTQLISVIDTTPPSFGRLPSVDPVEAETRRGAAVHFDLPRASDRADRSVEVTSSHAPGSVFPPGDTEVTFTARDDSGNSVTAAITVTVLYEPSLVANLTLAPTSDSITASWEKERTRYAVIIFPADAPKQVLQVPEFGASHVFAGLDPGREYKVSVHARGETSTASSGTVSTLAASEPAHAGIAVSLKGDAPTVRLSQSDEVTVPVTFIADGDIRLRQISAPRLASVEDLGNGTALVTVDPISHRGKYRVQLGATVGSETLITGVNVVVTSGARGGSADPAAASIPAPIAGEAQAAQPLGVAGPLPGPGAAPDAAPDTTPPSIRVGSASEHPYGVPYEDPGATCTDDRDPERTVYSDGAINARSPGPQALRYTCADAAGNEAQPKTRIVVVLDPWEEPKAPAEDPAEAPADEPAAAAGEPEAGSEQEAGHAGGSVPAAGTAPAGDLGDDPADVPADDPADEPAIEPVLNATFVAPPDITTEATGPLTAVELGQPAFPANHTVSNDAPGAFPPGPTTVTWTATGPSNHTSYQIVTITDTTPPVISGVPEVPPVAAGDGDSAAVEFSLPVALDLVDGDVPVYSSHAPGFLFQLGNTTVSFTASDSSGNESSREITISVYGGPPAAPGDAPSDETAEGS